MLDYAGSALKKVQDFIKRLNAVEDVSEETRDDVDRLKKELALLHRELAHTGKVVDHQGLDIEKLNARVKDLERQKHGLSSQLGREKSKNRTLAATPPPPKVILKNVGKKPDGKGPPAKSKH